MGTRLAMIALPWFVLETTGSPTYMGLVTAGEMGCYGLARVLGGPIMDRIGQRVVGVRADTLAAMALLCMRLMHSAGGLSLPVPGKLVVLVAMSTVGAEWGRA